MSQTSLTAWESENFSLNIWNLLFSSRETSSASSITLYRWIEELRTMFSSSSMRPLIGAFRTNDSSRMRRMGIIEFRGVRSSCATEEKYWDRTCCTRFSASFILVISVHLTMMLLLLWQKEVLTWMQRLGSLALNSISSLLWLLMS